MGKIIRQSIVMLVALTIATGVIYPLVVTGLAQALFPRAANGSVIERGGKALGSELIGQPFSDPKYFWARPSATAPFADNSAASTGSNLDPGNAAAVPVDLVTASGSGLDPDISPAAAQYQLARVARARGMEQARVAALVAQAAEGRQLGVLGEPRVNVLKLNLLLDGKG